LIEYGWANAVENSTDKTAHWMIFFINNRDWSYASNQ